MTFWIGFLKVQLEHPYEDPSTAAARGRIVLRAYGEEFLASLHEWTEATYQKQWRGAIASLIQGEDKAVLITNFNSPAIASHLEWWALYREGETIFAQNQLLFFDDLNREFEASAAVDFLRPRDTKNEEGLPISEWAISMDDLRSFVGKPGDRRDVF
jgi:hypothetical protein